jgi:hypothetical protein
VRCSLSRSFASWSYLIFISSLSIWNSSREREKAFLERQKADSSALRAFESVSRRVISDFRVARSCSADFNSAIADASVLRIYIS